MKTIVVTGGAGKVGRGVVAELLEHGYRVRSLDLVRVPVRGFQQVVTDLTDFGQFVDALDGADGLIHVAAIPAPGLRPAGTTFVQNMATTFNAFHAAATLGLPRVVWASSETVLGLAFTDNPPAAAPITEDSPTRCRSSYALSKRLGEHLAASFHREHGVASVGLRFTNVMEGEDYAKFGAWQDDPRQRAWNLWSYVDARDCGQACRLALESDLDAAEVVNVTADDTVMRRPSAELLAEVFPDAALGELPHERASLISSAKAERLLGYVPKHAWQDAAG